MITATSQTWLSTCAELADRGLSVVDWLTAVDREDCMDVIVCLVDPGSGECELVACRVAGDPPRLPTIATVFRGAEWHERETTEMFGVHFDGRETSEPLLLRGPSAPPMRKASPLQARVDTPWPAAEPDSQRRRRKLPPGVRAEWMPDGE